MSKTSDTLTSAAALLATQPAPTGITATQSTPQPSAQLPEAGIDKPPMEFEEYRLLRPLGRGAMGQVYLAHDTLLDRQVAIKFLMRLSAIESSRNRFMIEARAIARLAHPNVVTIHRVGQTGGWPFLVSEFIAGKSLDTVDKPVLGPAALRIALELARGLAAAHRSGVLHRDIKPANVMLAEDDAVKLLDFGLAKLLDDALTAPLRRSSEAPAVRAAALPRTGAEARLTLLGAQIGTPVYMAPEMWRGEPATPQVDVYSVGALIYELCSGNVPHTASTLDDLALQVVDCDAAPLKERAPAADPQLCAVVDRCLRRNPAERFASAEELAHALLRIHADHERPAGRRAAERVNPYRGLYSFEANHATLFFGRSREIQTLLDRLRSQPFLVVVGDSGVGKSSLCRAGVIPRVQKGALQDGRRWCSVTMFPGKHPLATLSDALSRLLGEPTDTLRIELMSQPGDCTRRLHRIQGEQDGILLFIDQLEEVLTQSEPEEAAAFGRVLVQLLARGPGVRVLCTVRGDFLTRLAELPGLGPELQQTLYLLRALDREALREAIVGPAEQSGVNFESPELIEELVATTLRTEGGLPLLQFTLAELWDARDEKTQQITQAALSKRAGVAGALSRHADRVIDTLLPAQRHAARRLLIKLVSSAGLRVRRSAAELLTADAEEGIALEALIAGRLLVVRETDGKPVYEIAHEALTSGWSRLREWLSTDAGQRAVHERLTSAAAEWQRLGQLTDALWNEPQLQEVTDIALEHTALSAREAEFLQRSVQNVRWRRRGRFVTRLLLANFAIATLVIIYLWSLKEQNRKLAAQERETRQSAQLAERAARALSLTQLPGREIPALLEIVKLVGPSLRRSEVPLPAALEGLSAAVDAGRRSRPLRGHTGRLESAVFSPDGQQVLTASTDHSVRLWDAQTGETLRVWADAGDFGGFSPNGRLIATASREGQVRLWERQTGALYATLQHAGNLFWMPSWSADAQHLGTSTLDATGHATTWLWDVPARRLVAQMPGSGLLRPQAAFSKDGTLLLTGEAGQTLSLWDARTGTRQATIATPRLPDPPFPTYASFSADGRWIIGSDIRDVWLRDSHSRALVGTFPGLPDQSLWVMTTSADGSLLVTGDRGAAVRLWDTKNLTLRATLAGHTGAIRAAAFSPDGSRLITGGQDETARVWDTATGQQLEVLRGHTERILFVDVSPDGLRILTASDDNTARIWDLIGGQHERRLINQTAEVHDAIYSRDGRYAATMSTDATVRVWDLASDQQLASLAQAAPLVNPAFSPDGVYLATGPRLANEELQVWDWRRGTIVAHFSANDSYINSITFSPDGKIIASACPDSVLRMWDWRTGQTVWTSDKQPYEATQIKFAADGLRFASTDVSGSVLVWDMKSKRVLMTSTDNTGRFTSADFSPDGTRLLTGGRKTRILDVASGQPVLELLGHLDATAAGEFSPDGKRVLTLGSDQTVRVFDAQTGQQLHILRMSFVPEGCSFSPDAQHILLGHPTDRSAKIYPATSQGLFKMACELLRHQPEWPEAKPHCEPDSVAAAR